MKFIRRIFILSLLVFILSVQKLPPVYAADYTVKSTIAIPSDWQSKISQTQLDQYKTAINSAMQEVQTLYRNLLGSTFSFDSNIEVKNLSINSQEANEWLSGKGDLIKLILGDNYNKTIKVAWLIGSTDGVSFAGAAADGKPPESDFAFMRHQDLIALSQNSYTNDKKRSLYYLAHELGHTFGLNFAGYGKGHPCTEVSTNECLETRLQPYPSAIEWTSIMGYGTPTESFPNLFFNNTIDNPEMWKVCQSPFIRCPSLPQPTPAPPKQDKPAIITGLSTTTIIAGQSFEIRGSGFNQITHFRLIKTPDLIDMASTQDRLKILEKSDGRIVLQTPEDLVPANTESVWSILGSGPATGNLYKLLGYTGRLTIKGKLNDIAINSQVKITCGLDKNPVPNIAVYLLPEGNDKILAKSITDKNGSASLSYTITNAVSSTEYHLITDPFKKGEDYINAITEDGSSVAKITIPQSPQNFTAATNFNFSECPEANPTTSPTPNPSSSPDLSPSPALVPVSSPTPIASSPYIPAPWPLVPGQTQTTNVTISNYPDFRTNTNNDSGDVGSRTITVPSGSTVDEWTLSTLDSSPSKLVYIRSEKADYNPVQMRDGDTAEVEGVTIHAVMVKKTVKMTITVNERDEEVDMNNPEGINIRLTGTAGQTEFNLPYKIEYSNGDIRFADLKVNYQPDPIGWECDEENNIFTLYPGGVRKISCHCGDDDGDCTGGADATICQPKAPTGSYTSDAECIEPLSSPSPTPLKKEVTGWVCDEENNIFEIYSDGTRKISCHCGDNSGDCTGGADATICQPKSPAWPYTSDAECIKSSPPAKTLIGWYCSNNSIFERYSNGEVAYSCTCGTHSTIQGNDCWSSDGAAATLCQSETPSSPYTEDAKCVKPPPPAKTIKGWECDGENNIFTLYSDGSRAISCHCGDNTGDCTGGVDATICQPKAPTGSYTSDAECKTPCTEGHVVRNECTRCRGSRQICQHANCSEYVCIQDEYNASCDWFNCSAPPPTLNCMEGCTFSQLDEDDKIRCYGGTCDPGTSTSNGTCGFNYHCSWRPECNDNNDPVSCP